MPRNIFIQTLNSIRSAMQPRGRDVAEAFDAVDQEVGQLKAQIAAIKPSTSTTVIKQTIGGAAGPSGSGGSQPYIPPIIPTLAKVTGNYTMQGTDVEIQITATGASTIKLQAGTVSPTGQMVTVKNYSASAVVITIEDNSGGTVDNAANIQMEWQYTAATFTWDGVSNWAIS